jgi:hypothetical protein
VTSEPAFDRDEKSPGSRRERHGDAGRRLGTDRREVADFSKVVSTAGAAAAVWIGVVGCAYRGAAVRLASEVQRPCETMLVASGGGP